MHICAQMYTLMTARTNTRVACVSHACHSRVSVKLPLGYTIHVFVCTWCLCFIQVPGKFELKGHDRVRSLNSLNVDRQNQFLPGQRRDITYVSRLQVACCIYILHAHVYIYKCNIRTALHIANNVRT